MKVKACMEYTALKRASDSWLEVNQPLFDPVAKFV